MNLRSALLSAKAGTTIRLSAGASQDAALHQPLDIARPRVTLTSANPSSPPSLGLYGSTIRVHPTIPVLFSGIQLAPGLVFDVQDGASVELLGVLLDHLAYLANSTGAQIAISNVRTARAWDTTAAIYLAGKNAKLTMTNVSIVDQHDNFRIQVTGVNNTVSQIGSTLSSIAQSGPCMVIERSDTSLSVASSVFDNCWANYGSGGGGLKFTGYRNTAVFSSSTMTNNGGVGIPGIGGGGFLQFQGTQGSVSFESCVLGVTGYNMIILGFGGSVHVSGAGTNLSFVRSSVANSLNINGAGSGLYFNGAQLLVEASNFSGNGASRGDGGGIYAITTLPLKVWKATRRARPPAARPSSRGARCSKTPPPPATEPGWTRKGAP